MVLFTVSAISAQDSLNKTASDNDLIAVSDSSNDLSSIDDSIEVSGDSNDEIANSSSKLALSPDSDEVTATDSSDEILGANGDTYYVNPSYTGSTEAGTRTQPYKSITNAVKKCAGGETLYLLNGEYTEARSISLTVPIKVTGQSTDGVIINVQKGLFSMRKNLAGEISIEKITVKGATTKLLDLRSTVGINLDNCKFINCLLSSDSNDLITLSATSGATITVTNCVLDNVKGKDIFKFAGPVTVDNVEVINSKLTGNYGSIFYVSSAEMNLNNIYVSNIACSANSYGVVTGFGSMTGSTVNIDNMTVDKVTGGTKGLMYLAGKSIVNIKNSKFTNNQNTYGIYNYVGNSFVESSVFSGNTFTTLYQNNGADNFIANMNYCALYDNTISTIVNQGTTDLSYNWWGSNDGIEDEKVRNWVLMNATPEFDGDKVTISVNFDKYTDGTTVRDMKKAIADGIEIKVKADSSDVDSVVYTKNGEATLTFTNNGDENAKITIGDQTFEVSIERPLDGNVTNENFFGYFNNKGILKEAVDFDELNFVGEFSNLPTIVLNRAIIINGIDAILNDIGFDIVAENVMLNNLTLNAVNSAGNLINVQYDNVNLTNLIVNYSVGDESATAINIEEASNVNLINNEIFFESHITSDNNKALGINVQDSNNVVIDRNRINVIVPALYVNNFEELGLNYVNSIRAKTASKLRISNNEIIVTSNDFTQSYPTFQAMLISEATDSEISNNNISLIDTLCPEGSSSYLYAINFAKSSNLNILNNNFVLSTEGGQDAAGTAYALQGTTSTVNIIGNNITSSSKGPNLGIYVASWMGESSELYIKDNTIDITGFASDSGSWALVSGIEIQNGNAKIYGNTINVKNLNDYKDENYLFGVSYAQYMYGERSFDIQNNTIITNGKYTISTIGDKNTPLTATGNYLIANELFADQSVDAGTGSDIIVKDNYPIESLISVEALNDNVNISKTVTLKVTVNAGATGNVTVIINGKKEYNVELENFEATIDVNDFAPGVNNVSVKYGGDSHFASNTNETTFTGVLDYVVNNVTFKYYFDESNGNNLFDYVEADSTLDFQGLFLGKYTVQINKPVNVISSTGDALFDSESKSGNAIYSFNVVAGGDHTNITGISFKNYCLYIKGASYVTVDDISIVANVRGVGSGTGFLSIHTGAYYTVVKNSYFENGGTGSSLLVLGKGGAYVVFDHNVFNITGSSGNILSANQYVGSGDAPEHTTYTNNILYNNQPASPFCYAMTVSGSGNLVENNTIHHNGAGILNQYGASSTGNVYRNNTITGTATFNPSANSIVENNKVEGTTTIAANTNATGNEFKVVTISGNNVNFIKNNVTGTVTVNSNGNSIMDNIIKSTDDYAINLKSTSENTVTGNLLLASKLEGDSAVSYVENKNNFVEDNFPTDPEIFVTATNVFNGMATTVTVNVPGATGSVTIRVNHKEYEVDLIDGVAVYDIDEYGEDYTINVTYNGDDYYYSIWDTTTFRLLDNVVEEDIFYDYFDESGFLRSVVPYDNLIFKGDFSNLVDYIIIEKPLTVTGENAVLKEMGFVISSSKVKLNNMTLITTSSLGNLIDVSSSNVELSNLNISYVVDDEEAVAISVKGSGTISNVEILNNNIYFESHVTSDELKTSAIAVDNVEDVTVDNNIINVNIPALYVETYDWSYFMMGLTYVNPIIIREANGLEFTSNELNVEVNGFDSSYPTVQAIYIVGSEDVLIESNNITMLDQITPAGKAIYLYGVESGWNDELVFKNNNFDIKTNGGANGAGSAYALQFVQTNADIIGNNIICESNGPNLAIYLPMGMGRAGNVLVDNNNITVIGLASTTSNYALVSGIEAQTGYLKAYNNTIFTINKNDEYNEKFNVYGISFAQTGAKTLSFDVKDNYINTNGHYAVAFNYATSNNIVTGNYLLSADLYGDSAVYIKSGDNVVENNRPYTPKLNVSVDNITIGQDALINVSIDNHATGNVVVIVDGKKYSLPIEKGSASIAVPNLRVNKYVVGVSYQGDIDVWKGDNKTTFSVSKIKSDAIITTTDLNVGQQVNVTVTIANATGMVAIIVDDERKDVELIDGVAEFTIDEISAGEHLASVIYMGDASHGFVMNTTKFNVEKIGTVLNVTSTEIYAGETAELDIMLSVDKDANVFVDIGGNKQIASLQNGFLHLSVPGLKIGTYNVVVTYNGDDIYEASLNSTASIIVNPRDSGLKANASNIFVGDDEVINVVIDKDVTGSVYIKLGETVYPVTVVEGKGSLIISDLEANNYTASVIFEGDDKFVASEVNITFIVVKKELPENINISMDIPEGTTSPSFTVTLPEDATGNFSVFVDGKEYKKELVNGSATITVENLSVGDHNVSVAYSGDNKYDEIETGNSTVNIPKASIPGGENAINMTSPEGTDSPSYSINLSSDARGNLTVTVDGKDNYTQALVNGSATVTVPKLSPGNHNITVTYTGDEKYSSISKNTPFIVSSPVVKISNNNDVTMLYTAKSPYKVLVTVDGKVVGAGETVTMKFNGKSYDVKTDKDGYATIKLPDVKPQKAKYTITAEYKGVSVSNKVKVNSIIKAKNTKAKKSKKVNKIKVTLKKVNGKVLKGKTLKLKIKGKTLKAKTNKKGVATFKVKKNVLKKLKVGKKYKFKVIFGKDIVTKKLTVKK